MRHRRYSLRLQTKGNAANLLVWTFVSVWVSRDKDVPFFWVQERHPWILKALWSASGESGFPAPAVREPLSTNIHSFSWYNLITKLVIGFKQYLSILLWDKLSLVPWRREEYRWSRSPDWYRKTCASLLVTGPSPGSAPLVMGPRVWPLAALKCMNWNGFLGSLWIQNILNSSFRFHHFAILPTPNSLPHRPRQVVEFATPEERVQPLVCFYV